MFQPQGRDHLQVIDRNQDGEKRPSCGVAVLAGLSAGKATGGHGCGCSRRALMLGALGVAGAAVTPTPALAGRETLVVRGKLCGLTQILDGERIEVDGGTGDRVLDRQLAATAHRIAEDFGVYPGLRIIHAPSHHADGAMALRDTSVSGTRGTVLFGKRLIFRELGDHNRRGWGGLAVTGVMAHEFAHIYQFFNGYDERLENPGGTVEVIELHADFLAGYHLGLRRRQGEQMDIGAATDLMYDLGDDNEQARGHHGRPGERRRALREGYRVGAQEAPPMDEAADIGARHAAEIARLQL
jgi:hypothetical protein